MKKTIKNIVVLLMATSLFFGCNDFLDVQPESTLSPGVYWTSKEDADAWRAGVYNQMQRTLRYCWFDWGEYRSDNVRSIGTGEAQTILLNNQLASTVQEGMMSWQELYVTISLCNFGLKYLPPMAEGNVGGAAATYQTYIGECYGMRALMYFYGLRVWGRIPIIPEAVEGLSQPIYYPRSSINDVRQQIISDIRMAIKYVGDITGNTDNNTQKYYLTKSAMYALLTDVYAWFQEYDRVIEVSDTLMMNSNLKWVANATGWKSLFLTPVSSTATENIFVMYWNSLEYNSGMGMASRLGSSGNTSNVGMSQTCFEGVCERYNVIARDGSGTVIPTKKSDARWWLCFDTVKYRDTYQYMNGSPAYANENRNAVQFGKFMPWDQTAVNTYGNGRFIYEAASVCNVQMPIYRYADIMTLRAEALALTGRYNEALEILKKVRSRVGYTPTEDADPTNYPAYYDGFANKGEKMQEIILRERQLEFMGEGKRWFDLCRVGKTCFTKPYYDEGGGKKPKVPDAGYYEYLKAMMNKNDQTPEDPFTNFEGDNMGRVFFPVYTSAFTGNPMLLGDQNPPYDE